MLIINSTTVRKRYQKIIFISAGNLLKLNIMTQNVKKGKSVSEKMSISVNIYLRGLFRKLVTPHSGGHGRVPPNTGRAEITVGFVTGIL
ncbi:MAG: hypothetical protein NVSMB45_11120 [Ginsengibacter sp.]